MRRRIRLTGRRQLKKSAVKVGLNEVGGKPLLTMTIQDREAFRAFPPEARISLALVENKGVEVADMGTVGSPRTSCNLRTRTFVAPSCQLRVADPGTTAKGLLLGSTDGWTLRGEDQKDKEAGKGILQFLAADTYPQSWKLEFKENDYPIVRVDKRIPNAAMWARTDPVFVGTVLPTVVREIFEAILREDFSDDVPWVVDWLNWGASILPDSEPPIGENERSVRVDFVDRLLNSFCARHSMADNLLQAAKPQEV